MYHKCQLYHEPLRYMYKCLNRCTHTWSSRSPSENPTMSMLFPLCPFTLGNNPLPLLVFMVAAQRGTKQRRCQRLFCVSVSPRYSHCCDLAMLYHQWNLCQRSTVHKSTLSKRLHAQSTVISRLGQSCTMHQHE